MAPSSARMLQTQALMPRVDRRSKWPEQPRPHASSLQIPCSDADCHGCQQRVDSAHCLRLLVFRVPRPVSGAQSYGSRPFSVVRIPHLISAKADVRATAPCSRDLNPSINKHWRRPSAWQSGGRFTAELLPCAVRRSMGRRAFVWFQWRPTEEQCSFAPSLELRLEML